MKNTTIIITNSLNMFFNYRSKLYDDLIKLTDIKFYLSAKRDYETLEEVVELRFNTRSSSMMAFLGDLLKTFALVMKLKRENVIVFTARNILLFGLSALILQKELNIAYFAGLGEFFTEKRRNTSMFNWIFKKILTKYSMIFTLNKRDYEYVRSVVKCDDKVLLLNGEGYEFSFPSSNEAKARFDYGVVGRLNQAKGATLLIDLALKCPNKSFVVWGELDADIMDLKFPKNVTFMGFEKDKSMIFESFKCLLFLSDLNEGLPFVFFEAIDYRKRILAKSNETTQDFLRAFNVISHSKQSLLEIIGNTNGENFEFSDSLLENYSYQNCNKKLLGYLNDKTL